MAREIRLYAGTKKGAFRFCSNNGRKSWNAETPTIQGWQIYHYTEDPRDPSRLYAAANHDVWGPMVARSLDAGRTWNMDAERSFPEDVGKSPSFPPELGIAVKNVWYIKPGHADHPGEVWCGVDPGSLFRSEDWGANWQPVPGLNEHPTREMWQPGGGGLCLHKILLDKANPSAMMVTISAGGAFRTEDGGASWTPINQGLAADFMPDPNQPAGHCVHCLVQSPTDPNWLFQQNHCGYYRSADGGKSWQDVGAGLPSSFGFPAAIHPHEPKTVYVMPLEGDSFRAVPNGEMIVWRSRDGGDNWEPLRDGLPQNGAYVASMRSAMATDSEDEAGIYVGTSNGQIFFSPDAGDHWTKIADYLPPILSLEVAG